ncbi:MAG: MFS transporter [Actinomycetota bacterium]|nr:MFS transporter [Actinomycetota bacterium]
MTATPVPLRRNRDFLLLWSGLAVSVLGSRISATAYPLLVLALTGSPADAGLVGFLATLPWLLFQLPAGALVDRWDRRRVMLVADAARGLALASVVAALATGRLALWQLMVVAFLEGTLFVFFNLAEHAAVRHVVPRTQLPTALSQNEARVRGAGLLGQPLGGVLFDLGRAMPFLADALSYAVSFVSVSLIRSRFRDETEEEPGALRRLPSEIGEGVAWLWNQPFLRAASILVAGSNFLFQALSLTLIVVVRDGGASGSTIGIMLAGAGAGGVLGSLAAPWLQRRLTGKAVVIGANWVWAVFLPAMLLTQNPYALGALYAAMAFVGPAWNVVIGAYQLSITPDRLLARVSSVETLVAYGAIPLGSLAGGFAVQALGGLGAIAALAGWMIVVALAATATPSIRRAPRLLPASA